MRFSTSAQPQHTRNLSLAVGLRCHGVIKRYHHGIGSRQGGLIPCMKCPRSATRVPRVISYGCVQPCFVTLTAYFFVQELSCLPVTTDLPMRTSSRSTNRRAADNTVSRWCLIRVRFRIRRRSLGRRLTCRLTSLVCSWLGCIRCRRVMAALGY